MNPITDSARREHAADALPRHARVAPQIMPSPMKRIELSAALLCGVLHARRAENSIVAINRVFRYLASMVVTLPEDVAALKGMDERDVKRELAVALYAGRN
jgi:hypothetical protein